MRTYDKILNNLNITLLKNKESYQATRNIFANKPNQTLTKFNTLIETINTDIRNGTSSNNINFTEQEELNLFSLVLYYRLVRNLISIECLLEYASPESEHFDCTEYSIGILLRANLLDCKLLYRSRSTSDINRSHLDSFQNFLNKLDAKRKKTKKQKNRIHENDTIDIDQEIDFLKRIISSLTRNIENDTPPLDPIKFNQGIVFFESIEKSCIDLYQVYSKYDHFSLYEISRLHWSREKKIENMHNAVLLHIPALMMCFGVLQGVELTPENVKVLGKWLEEGLEI